MGPQGSGKGTQAQGIAGRLGIAHISTGEMFRQLAQENDPAGLEAKEKYWSQGKLVPDDLTNKLIKIRLQKPDAQVGFILDGYPRNLAQAEFLASINSQVNAVYLDLTDDEAVKRISGRRTCSLCGAVYHVQFKPPQVADKCDIDTAALIQRPDDVEQVVRERLAIFHSQTEPLLQFYEQQGKLIKINGAPPIAQVTEQIKQALEI